MKKLKTLEDERQSLGLCFRIENRRDQAPLRPNPARFYVKRTTSIVPMPAKTIRKP